MPEGVRQFADFELDRSAYQLRRKGRPVRIERIPLDLLFILAERPGQLVTREEILARIWGKDVFIETDTSINAAIRKIRQALRDDAETPRFVATVPTRGYRFIAPLREAEPVTSNGNGGNGILQHTATGENAPGIAQPPATVENRHRPLDLAGDSVPERKIPDIEAPANAGGVTVSHQPRVGRLHRIALGIAIVAALGVLAAASWKLMRSQPADRHARAMNRTIRSIAVLPLENLSGDPGQEYLADGMTEELITDLAKISKLRVISRTSVMKFKGDRREQLPEIAKALNVDAIAEGSVLRVGDKVRITAQLIDAANDKNLWARSYERDARDVLAIQDEIAAAIAREIDVELTPQDQTRLAGQPGANFAAIDAFLRGRYFLTSQTGEGYRKATEYFEQAVKIAPEWPTGYVGIAAVDIGAADLVVSDREAMPKAKALLETALRLDPASAAAHMQLAIVDYYYDFDWIAAESEFKQAIEAAPSSGDIHGSFGTMLTYQGRFDEAQRELTLAQELDPLSPDKSSGLGWLFDYQGHYSQAIEQFGKALEVAPDFWMARVGLGFGYGWMGNHDLAMKEFQQAATIEASSFPIAMLGLGYAKLGNRDQAREVLERLTKLSAHMYVSPVPPALIYLALGDKNTALDLLEKAYQERSGMLCTIKVNRDFDSLRSDPRFIRLLKQVGLNQ